MKKGVLGVTVAASLAFVPLALADAGKGEALFNDKKGVKCVMCHSFEKKVIGPNLSGVSKRHSRGWIIKWLTDTQGTWTSNDPETLDLKKRQGKEGKPKPAHMTPKISPEQAADLADFLMTK